MPTLLRTHAADGVFLCDFVVFFNGPTENRLIQLKLILGLQVAPMQVFCSTKTFFTLTHFSLLPNFRDEILLSVSQIDVLCRENLTIAFAS